LIQAAPGILGDRIGSVPDVQGEEFAPVLRVDRKTAFGGGASLEDDLGGLAVGEDANLAAG
jgi:hypothetical protein